MARPSKPAAVIEQEGKSHRTKAELEARKRAEASLATGFTFKERLSVRQDAVAHKEFLRVKKLLQKIDKNDALFESIINRYCELTGEIEKLKEERDRMYGVIDHANAQMNLIPTPDEKQLAQFMQGVSKLYSTLIRVDTEIENKRKMLLTIEKETCMTVAAQLRTIPKTEEKASSPLLEALKV